MGIKHSTTKVHGEIGEASEWNDDHVIDSDVDFAQKKAIKLVADTGNAWPAGPVEGQVFYRTDLDTYFIWTGAAWTQLGGVGAEPHARLHPLSSVLDHSVPVANVDFNHYQGISFVVEKGAAFPAAPVAGQIFYRTDVKWLYVYDGTTWVGSGGLPQKFEFYDAGDDTAWSFWGTTWSAQTFTVGTVGINIPFTTYSVKLKLWRNGAPGTMTVSIRATDIDGKPTGADLAVGSIDGNTLTPTSPGLWYEIPLTPVALSAATKYAIVVRCPDGAVLDFVAWRNDQTAPTYAGGSVVASNDSGATWSAWTGYDFMFEVWGKPA